MFTQFSIVIEELEVFGHDCDVVATVKILGHSGGWELDIPEIREINVYDSAGERLAGLESIGHSFEEAVEALESDVQEYFWDNQDMMQEHAAEKMEQDAQEAEDSYWDSKLQDYRDNGGRGTMRT